ncbi:phosphoglycerate kinase [Candidatus Dojkabacteria bacterium]|uniref:Phosphoglycerate kinase n=1 Tax=Candidatus Dojkabacteria bacterium TaxID=2099670 RepID=A0A5C7J3Q7_9BACT|nr:MAG: phosphoglycerate kinase [Candidatus Dojkabacteria bacterium]
MQSLVSSNIQNKRVIFRVDYNVPINSKGIVENDARIMASKPSLDYLLSHANKVIIITYLGRPEKYDPSFSLKPVAKKLQELYPDYNVILVDNFINDDSSLINQKEKEIILLENIRFYPEEQKNNEDYIKKIAGYADVFVNDAFSMSHRNEATITGLPRYLPSYAGFLLEKEVTVLKKALEGKGKPRITVLGGAKVSTKIQLIERFIDVSDYVLLGGALANTFLATQGQKMGASLYEKNFVQMAGQLISKAKQSSCTLLLPTDFITNKEGAILDIGTKTIEQYTNIIAKAHTIIWNGTMGYYEDPNYRAGSDAIFSAIAANHRALSIIGGGDTLAILQNKQKDQLNRISHISTGGGAMLELIENGTLPGIEALTTVR